MAAPLDKRLLQRATATRVFLVAVAVIGIINAALIICQAWLIAEAVAGIFYHHSFDFPGPLPSFGYYVAGLAIVFCLRGVLSWLSSVLAYRCSASVKSTLRTDVMDAYLRRPTDATTSSGSLINLVTSGLHALDGYFEKYLPQLVMAAFIPLLVIAVIWTQDLRSALIVIVTIPLIPIFMILIGLQTQKSVQQRFSLQTRLANHFSDLIKGLPTLQVFGRARAQLKGLDDTETQFRTVTLKTLRVAFLSGGVLELLATLSVALIAVTIGFRVVAGELDLYTSLFILVMAPEAYLPIRMVGVHFHDSANGTAAANAAFEVIEKAQQVHTGTTSCPDLATSTIVFDNVGLTYPAIGPNAPEPKPAVESFCATINPGEALALVGKSGAGKSTALAILMGFIAPTSGRVLIGGVDLATIDLASWRRQIAYVAQDPGMIRGTIADNIRMGFPDATDTQIRETLDQAGGSTLDPGRHVGDDGEGLSAGERRRVALARALIRIRYAGGRVLVLDEPTAGLDQVSEAIAIQSVLDSGATSIFVTHRESMLAMATSTIHVDTPSAALPREVTR